MCSFSSDLRLAPLKVVFLAQVLLEARELVHNVDVYQHHRVQNGHGDLANQGEQEGHEAEKDAENNAAATGVHETEVHRDHSGYRLQFTNKI